MPSAMPQRISCGSVPVRSPTSSAPMRISVALADEHRDVSGGHSVDIGDVHTHLIHAHDPDDRAAVTANREVPGVGQRARQSLPVSDGRGGDPARRLARQVRPYPTLSPAATVRTWATRQKTFIARRSDAGPGTGGYP